MIRYWHNINMNNGIHKDWKWTNDIDNYESQFDRQKNIHIQKGQLLLAAWYLANDTIMNYEVDYELSYHNFWKHENW